MTIIVHHRDRVYSDRQNTCYICEKVIDVDKEDWTREKDTVWHDRCSELENAKEAEAFRCTICNKVIGYITWADAPDYVYCLECKKKYK